MAEDKERLSGSAAKAKRNLLFFAVVSWALALGWIRLSHEGRVALAGIGADTTVRTILGTLAALLAYNLISFWLHGPFGDSRSVQKLCYILSPTHGTETNAGVLLQYMTSTAGANSLPDGITNPGSLDVWLNAATGKRNWHGELEDRKRGLEALWLALSWRTQLRLWWRALRYRTPRLLILEDLWDTWLPLGVGLTGLVAIAFAFWRLL